jgi:hypothetical protein
LYFVNKRVAKIEETESRLCNTDVATLFQQEDCTINEFSYFYAASKSMNLHIKIKVLDVIDVDLSWATPGTLVDIIPLKPIQKESIRGYPNINHYVLC